MVTPVLSENEILTLDQMDQIMIDKYEAKKEEVLDSDIPAFFSQDPSIY
jgi:hypothetical protein